ncbi:MAG: hypothetical protein E7108_01800 [Bacteroidales bacterium]|nr:hypothetical protein [Bacteroidales bacterium]
MKKTQQEQVREILMTKGSITPLEALNICGCFRLGSIIHRLRKEGMDIKTEDERNAKGNIYARYTHRVSEDEIDKMSKELFSEILSKYEKDGGGYLVLDRSKGQLYLTNNAPDYLPYGECQSTAGLSVKDVAEMARQAIVERYRFNLKSN